MDHQPAQSQSGCKQRRPNHIPAVTSISSGSTGRRVDATTGEEIARQAAADADTAPVLTTDEILAASRRILPEDVADVRALRTRPGLRRKHSQRALASRATPSTIRKPPSCADRAGSHTTGGDCPRAKRDYTRFGAWLNSKPAKDVAKDCFGPRCRPTSCGEGLFRRS